MALFLKRKVGSTGEMAIWQIEEPESFFLQNLELTIQEEQRFQKIKGRRRLEWIAARWLLHYLSNSAERIPCVADEFGKPHLENSNLEISISHSQKLVTVVIDEKNLGVDIQLLVSKIKRIAHKFMREEESDSLVEDTMIEQLHVYWGAKEALYKAYGRKELDFKKHIMITPFFYDGKGSTKGLVEKGKFKASFDVFYEKLGDYMLVYALECTNASV